MAKIKRSAFTILFVDDEEKARKYFARSLEQEFNILTAADVDEAKKIIARRHREIAVVITDQRMPGGNGVKLLQYLREEFPDIIRLLTTAYSDLTDAIDSVNKGEILRYIQKPWDYDMLRHEMRQALNLFEIRKEYTDLLYEKIAVKRSMTKINRVKQLILLSKTINHIRFADLAVKNFIRQFAGVKSNNQLRNNNQEQDWKDAELGNGDLLETLFLLRIINEINNKIPFNQNYQFENTLNSKQILELVEELVKPDNIVLKTDFVAEIAEIEINYHGFKVALAELLKYITKISKELSLKIDAAADNQLLLSLKMAANDKINDNDDNIFFAPSAKVDEADSHISLLIGYLLIHHHGGKVQVENTGDKIEYLIFLPQNPKAVISENNFSSRDLDDILLAVIMSDA
jgi:CheY-like chemotaxis protein